MSRTDDLLNELKARLVGLESQAELIKTVLIVKEPNTIHAAEAYEGLRKQIVASAAERHSHLAQIVAMAVAVARATSVDDLAPQVNEWMAAAAIALLTEVPSGADASHVFEDVGGAGLNGPLEVLEPAYIDLQTGVVLRLGRAQRARPQPPVAKFEAAESVAAATARIAPVASSPEGAALEGPVAGPSPVDSAPPPPTAPAEDLQK